MLRTAGCPLRHHVVVDPDGRATDTGASEADAHRPRARTRRPVPHQLHVGHDRHAEVRDAHAEPLDVLPPARRRCRRHDPRRRVPQCHSRTLRVRHLDRARDARGARRAHGRARAVRRRVRDHRDRAGAGHRARVREHAVPHDVEVAGDGAARPVVAALHVHRWRGGARRTGGALRGRDRRAGAAVLRFERDGRVESYDHA